MEINNVSLPGGMVVEGREEEEGISPANWPGFWFLIHFTRWVREQLYYLGLTEHQLPI